MPDKFQLTEEREQRIKAIAQKWGIYTYDSTFFDERYFHAEAVLHDVCHGVALGLPIDHNVSDRVTNHFYRLNRKSDIFGLVYEAQTLAIESYVLRCFGWQRKVPIRKLLAYTWKYGTSGQALSKEVYTTLHRRFVKDENTEKLATVAASKFRKLVDARVKN